MSNPYAAFCDDFYVNMRLGSQMNLPHQRETVLHCFERVQKDFPGMVRFRRGDGGNEFSLEEERGGNGYRWVSIESKRLSSGHVNPPSVEEAMRLHNNVLRMTPHYLGLSPLEIEYVDILFGFDMQFAGNHDEIIAESLCGGGPLSCLLEETGAKPVDFQPTVTVSLSDDCRLQARIDIVTRTNSYQIRTGDYADDVISVYLILRRYWGDRPKVALEVMAQELSERAEALTQSHIAPKVLRPIAAAISSRS